MAGERVSTCEHCHHDWSRHNQQFGENLRCDCGCMWSEPKPPEPPQPPPDPRIALAETAIFDELDRQHEPGDIGGAGYWDREWGCLDGEPDWGAVARAVVRALDEQGDA